ARFLHYSFKVNGVAFRFYPFSKRTGIEKCQRLSERQPLLDRLASQALKGGEILSQNEQVRELADRAVTRDHHRWLESNQGVQCSKPARNQAIHGQRNNPAETDIPRNEHAWTREPYHRVGWCVRGR